MSKVLDLYIFNKIHSKVWDMAIFLILLIGSFSFAVENVAKLPAPWEAKQDSYDKLDVKMIEAGAQLFSDTQLSRNHTISCASCHIPEYAFSNGQVRAKGFQGVETEYNVPVLFNRIGSKLQFWDGRVHSLFEQIFEPIQNPLEMGASEKMVLQRLNSSPSYKKMFGGIITRKLVATALESYISSLVSGNSRYDQYVAGDLSVLTEDEIGGKKLFFETYKCDRCHSGPGFTNDILSLRCGSQASSYSTLYKVPTLRNLRTSGPYLHNGRLNTLEEVLEFYDQGNNEHGFAIKPNDKAKLISFLNTLNAPIVSYVRK
ncbi:MAG: cytochrome-c peroxidase [Bdellovibrionales bacterium]